MHTGHVVVDTQVWVAFVLGWVSEWAQRVLPEASQKGNGVLETHAADSTRADRRYRKESDLFSTSAVEIKTPVRPIYVPIIYGCNDVFIYFSEISYLFSPFLKTFEEVCAKKLSYFILNKDKEPTS